MAHHKKHDSKSAKSGKSGKLGKSDKAGKKPAKKVTTFTHPIEIEVRRPDFKLLDSVSHLDIASLEKAGRAEIEMGTIETDCCRQFVHAVIRKGMVTSLRTRPARKGERDKKDESEPASPELAHLLETAFQQLPPSGEAPPQFPIPVADFMARANLITVDWIRCVQICFFGVCIQCCEQLGTDNWLCGRVIVDTTSLP